MGPRVVLDGVTLFSTRVVDPFRFPNPRDTVITPCLWFIYTEYYSILLGFLLFFYLLLLLVGHPRPKPSNTSLKEGCPWGPFGCSSETCVLTTVGGFGR